MAKQKRNVVTRGLSGKVDDLLVFQQPPEIRRVIRLILLVKGVYMSPFTVFTPYFVPGDSLEAYFSVGSPICVKECC
jgi:hypothetical protein